MSSGTAVMDHAICAFFLVMCHVDACPFLTRIFSFQVLDIKLWLPQ